MIEKIITGKNYERVTYSLFVSGILFFFLSLIGIKDAAVFLSLCAACGAGMGFKRS